MTGPTQVVGVDGYAKGWIAASLIDGALRWRTHRTFADVLDTYRGVRMGVDIPIGLAATGSRPCDAQARRFATGSPSSVFAAPSRALVEAYEPGQAYPGGRGISRQGWNLVPKIREVDRLMTPDIQRIVTEVHPECSFRAMAPAESFESKKTAVGAGQRIAALASWAELPDFNGSVALDIPSGVPLDDVLDAAAAAWTARRWRENRGIAFPAQSAAPVDERGLRMQIWV